MVKISLASGKKEVYPGAGAPGTPNVASPLVVIAMYMILLWKYRRMFLSHKANFLHQLIVPISFLKRKGIEPIYIVYFNVSLRYNSTCVQSPLVTWLLAHESSTRTF